MAPVDIEHEPGLMPLALASSRLAAAAYASYTVGRSLYQSHKALAPAQHTRHRIAERTKLTTAFGSLAVLGLVFAVTSSWDYLTLSYKTWASERGVGVPDSPFETHASSANVTGKAPLYLRHWLGDTPIFLDGLEIVAEKTRRLWWGQQLDLATISWTALLAIEGRRRKIPHLWAYALLPHLVSLSFAQNLFYVALLQTPSPIPAQETRIARFVHRLLPKKPRNWFPKLSLLIVPVVLNYLATLWLPSTAGTSSFSTAVILTRLLTLAPLVLPAIAPASWGTVHSDPYSAYPGITKLFNVISAASALLHAKTTVSALLYNLPDSYKQRHSIHIPFDTEKRTKWERTATAAEKVLGSMTDHPAVTAAGKDVLLSALRLGLWAAVRSTDIRSMLGALWSGSKGSQHFGMDHSLSGRPAKIEPSSHDDGNDDAKEGDELSGLGPALSINPRRSGRTKKTSVSSIGSSIGVPEDITTTTSQTPRRRGRPRKVKPEPEPEPELDPTPEPEVDEDGLEPEEDDYGLNKTYQPTPAVKAQVGLGDVLAEDDFDWEPAALGWGLTALGGLGLGSAAVYGAECVSR